MMQRRPFLLGLAALSMPDRTRAAPMRYVLDPEASSVGFTFTLSGTVHRGQMPLKRADIMIDPDDLATSTADVSVLPDQARTGLFLATEALKSASVLDTRRYPEIRFVSTRVHLAPSGRLSDGAALTGNLTIRDVTRPVRLDATLWRAAGSAPDDLSQLVIRLRGAVQRSQFGATGYADLVADTVGIDIRAAIRQRN